MKAQVKAKATLEVEIEPREIGYAIRQYITHEYGTVEDGGCDVYTDDDGNSYVAGNPEWRAYPQDKRLTALIDAMHIMLIGYPLQVERADA